MTDTELERERLGNRVPRPGRLHFTLGLVALGTAVASLVLLPILGLIALQHQGCEARLKSYNDRLAIIDIFTAPRTHPPTSNPDLKAAEAAGDASRATQRATLLGLLGEQPHC